MDESCSSCMLYPGATPRLNQYVGTMSGHESPDTVRIHMRKGWIETRNFLNKSLKHSIQKELHSSDPDTVKHHRLAELLNISMLSTVHWHFAGNVSGNVRFSFPVFTHCYLKPPMCKLASITLSLKKGNVEQAKKLKLNLDSSRRNAANTGMCLVGLE